MCVCVIYKVDIVWIVCKEVNLFRLEERKEWNEGRKEGMKSRNKKKEK